MKLISFLILYIFIFTSCSTERNTLVNRSYHGMTAHYNGYFNANELINNAMLSFKTSKKEDYYSLLPIELVPNKIEVEGMLPSIDTAISKCKKVISNHCMPSVSDLSTKKAEHNKWIDENWITIGIANYYKLDYDMALKNFDYINRFFSNDPSNYLAAVWMVKTNIKLNNISEAKIILKKIDKNLEELEDLAKDKKDAKKGDKSSSKKSKSKKAEKPKAPFPKKTKYLLELTRAELLLLDDETEKAIEALEKALKLCKKSQEKARINYILGQLNVVKSDSEKAFTAYSKVLKYNAPFEMNFSARINRAMLGGDSKLKNQLLKMLRDEKNAEFKDQIYYALAEISFKEGQGDLGKQYLTKSIFYSVSNNRQKAMCYERLGDFSYQERNYISAQKYYDSCVTVLTDTYPNADVIRNKAIKLKDLVIAVETAQYEDSVLRIASMSEKDRENFANKVIKKIKEEEEKKKLLDEARLKEIQKVQMANAEAKSTTKFFWNHAKTKEEGLESFRKQWGQRENEDDWRRLDKIKFAPIIDTENDSILNVENKEEKEDSLTSELLLSRLPISDSSKTASYERMFNALFDAGVIYNDQLKETNLAVQQYEKIINRNVPSKFVLMALFQLYKIHETSNPTLAYPLKQRILSEYPNSDYARYLEDPDFFVKQKQFEKLNEEDFVKMLDRYNRGLHSLVISGSEDIIENHPENLYRSKYMLLTALAVGQTNSNKRNMIPTLKRIVLEYPGSMEEKRAKELLDLIENGYSAFVESNFEKQFIYSYVEAADHWVIIFLPKNHNSMLAKSKIVDFNKDNFGKDQLNVSSKIYGDDQSVIVIKTFNEFTAKDYINEIKRNKKDLKDIQNEKIYFITQENLKILFDSQKLSEYDEFFTEFY